MYKAGCNGTRMSRLSEVKIAVIHVRNAGPGWPADNRAQRRGEGCLLQVNGSGPGGEGKKERVRMQVYVAVRRSSWPNGPCRNRGGGSVRHAIKPRSGPYYESTVKILVPCGT
jgi:hypothetical protein